MAIVNLQLERYEETKRLLETIAISDLEQREYLFYGCYAEYYAKRDDLILAISYLDKAILRTSNALEKEYLQKKKEQLEGSI